MGMTPHQAPNVIPSLPMCGNDVPLSLERGMEGISLMH